MSSVNLTFRVTPIPATFSGDLNSYAQAIANRLSAETGTPTSLISSGNVLPTSDVGPFWKEDTREWYGWSSGSGSYIPATVNQASLKFIAQGSAPDQTIYTFWIELSAGKAIAIKYYSGGSWKDVYEDKFGTYSTTSQMNTAIDAAILAAKNYAGTGAFKASCIANQPTASITGPDNEVIDIVFGQQDYDPDSCYDPGTSSYTVPSAGFYEFNLRFHIDTDSGSPTGLSYEANILKDSVVIVTAQTYWDGGSLIGELNVREICDAADIITANIDINVTSGTGVLKVVGNNTTFSGLRIR